jgi:glycosyltransferase involved in cell wall biosynthesis
MNICMLLFQHYDPDMPVYPQIEICSYLRYFGHKVTWIMWEDRTRQINSYDFNGIQVYTVPYIHYIPNHSTIGTYLNLIPNTVRRINLISQILKDGGYDLISVVDYAFDCLVPNEMKKRYDTPFVYQLQNPLEQYYHPFAKYWPGTEKRDTSFSTLIGYIPARFHEYIGVKYLHKADLVLPISKWMKIKLVEQGINEKNIMECPSGVDTKTFANNRKAEIRNECDATKCKTIIYVGTLDKLRNLEVLLLAFSEVLVKNRNTKLIIVGEGNGRLNLKQLTVSLHIDEQVVFTGLVARREIPSLIASADIGVSLVPPLSFYKLSSPIKILEYMAMGKPVVANSEIYEQREILGESGGGILTSFDSPSIAGSIIKLLNDTDEAVSMGEKGKEWILKNRDYEILARKVEEKYLQIIRKNGKSV